MFVTHDLQVARGTTLRRDVALPDVPDEQIWESPSVDRIGEVVQDWWKPLGAFGAATTVAGAVLAGRGGRGLIKSGAWGLLAGATAIGGSIALANALRPDQNRATDEVRKGLRAPAASPTPRAPGEQIRMMTFNVRGGIGNSGFFSDDKDFDRLAAHIREQRPDILVLQEVDRFALRSSGKNSLDQLARRLGADSAVASYGGTLVTGRQQGCAILTFNGFRVANARGLILDDPEGSSTMRRVKGYFKFLSDAYNEQRGQQKNASGTSAYSPREAIDSVVVTPDGNHVRVTSHHFGGLTAQHDYQKHQLPPFAAALDAWDGPTLVGGDFNIHSGTAAGVREREMLGVAGLTDSFIDMGVEPGDKSVRGSVGSGSDIDRIYRSEEFKTKDVRVVREDKPWASDHLAVVADFQLDGAPRGAAGR